jgi:hypothetical protein
MSLIKKAKQYKQAYIATLTHKDRRDLPANDKNEAYAKEDEKRRQSSHVGEDGYPSTLAGTGQKVIA